MPSSARVGGDVTPQPLPSTIRGETAEVAIHWPLLIWKKYMKEVGMTSDDVHQLGKKFSIELAALTTLVRDRNPDNWEDDAQLDEALRLTEELVKPTLLSLRTLGISMREAVDSIVQDLQEKDYLMTSQTRQKPITFCESQKSDQSKHPIWWELIYEGPRTTKAEWKNFWGFWVPITHWLINQPSTGKIKLDNGAFTAVHDKLPFACSENKWLTKKITAFKEHYQGAWEYQSLDSALRNALRGRWTELEAKFRRPATPPNVDTVHGWLDKILKEYPEEPIDRSSEIGSQLMSIFKDPNFSYQIIHFACHSNQDEGPQFLTTLEVLVGGEPIEITAGSMVDWRRQTHEDTGALVFLNACGTAKTDANAPPIFPVQWIKLQGALAVIATLCPIPDYFAFAFARKFYCILFEAVEHQNESEKAIYAYVAEALMKTRRHFLDEYNNPLGLAYICYASDNAHLVAPTLLQGKQS